MICIDLTFLYKIIRAGDLLSYATLVLAYIAFSWSVNRDFEAWKSLFLSFKSDLDSQKWWIGGDGYSQSTYNDKKSFSPMKIVYPLSFVSLQEIIRRGVGEFSWISDRFLNNLSLFNERVVAFNSLLEHINRVISVNPILSEQLRDKLNNLGLQEDDVDFYDFKKNIRQLKNSNKILYLAENIRRFHRIIHVELIGNKNKEDSLNYLFHEIKGEIKKILDNFDKRKPWFIRYKMWLVIFSLFIFFLIEIFLR